MCTNMHDETYVFPRTGSRHSEETKAKISAKVQAALAGGGGGKFIPSEETRAKMSAAATGNKHWLGKKHSEESKAKMGRPVRMIDPNGVATVYPRTTAIKEQHGIFLPTILRSIMDAAPLKKGPYKGWRFEYV